MKTTIFMLLLTISLACAQSKIVNSHPPSFHLDVAAKRKLVEKALTLRAGDTFATITNALGNPTLDQVLFVNKEGRSVDRRLRYNIVIWERDKFDEALDEFITLSLGEGDRLQGFRINVTLR
jgi:hypothetical protein